MICGTAAPSTSSPLVTRRQSSPSATSSALAWRAALLVPASSNAMTAAK
jgi:hypothetical protein